jgi:hypothetical protein
MKLSFIMLSSLLLLSTCCGSFFAISKVDAATDGLVGYWSLDEGTGDVAYDTSGYGNNGSLVNAPSWTDGIFGKAVQFDGIDDCVEVPHSGILNNANFTIEAWIYLDEDIGNTQARIVSKQQTNAFSYSMNIFGKGLHASEGNQLVLSTGTGMTWIHLQSNTYLANKTWYHVAATHEDTTSKLYINGTLDISGTTAIQTTLNLGVLTIGCLHMTGYNATYFFPGVIDDVRIYSRALSQAEIAGDMIPEFPSFLILPFFMIAALMTIVLSKRRQSVRRVYSAIGE